MSTFDIGHQRFLDVQYRANAVKIKRNQITVIQANGGHTEEGPSDDSSLTMMMSEEEDGVIRAGVCGSAVPNLGGACWYVRLEEKHTLCAFDKVTRLHKLF